MAMFSMYMNNERIDQFVKTHRDLVNAATNGGELQFSPSKKRRVKQEVFEAALNQYEDVKRFWQTCVKLARSRNIKVLALEGDAGRLAGRLARECGVNWRRVYASVGNFVRYRQIADEIGFLPPDNVVNMMTGTSSRFAAGCRAQLVSLGYTLQPYTQSGNTFWLVIGKPKHDVSVALTEAIKNMTDADRQALVELLLSNQPAK